MARTPNETMASPAAADKTNTRTSIFPPSTPSDRVGCTANKKVNKGSARSSAPSPPIPSMPAVLESVETDTLYHHHLRHSQRRQVARSNAPSPPFFSTTTPDPDQEPSPIHSHGPAPSELMHALSKLSREQDQERTRSNAPSPSPTLDSSSVSASEAYHRTLTEIERDQPGSNGNVKGKGDTKGQKHRLFRSAAPSPDREVTPPTTTATPSEKSGSGIVPAKNTPVKKTYNSGGRAGMASSLMRSPTRLGYSGSAAVMQTQAEEGEYYDDEYDEVDGDADENDSDLRRMYRCSVSSITNTVSVVNSPATDHVGAFGVFGTFGVEGGLRGQGGQGGERMWNPPHAPREMKSHLVTWINDKKVGERINGVQVPSEEGDQTGFEFGSREEEEGKKTKIEAKEGEEAKKKGKIGDKEKKIKTGVEMDVEGKKEGKAGEKEKKGLLGLGDKLLARKKDDGRSPDKKGKRKA